MNIELINYEGKSIQESLGLLIKKIWREERMPEKQEGQIVTIHENGDQQKSKICRGIIKSSWVLNSAASDLERLLGMDIAHEHRIALRRL